MNCMKEMTRSLSGQVNCFVYMSLSLGRGPGLFCTKALFIVELAWQAVLTSEQQYAFVVSLKSPKMYLDNSDPTDNSNNEDMCYEHIDQQDCYKNSKI